MSRRTIAILLIAFGVLSILGIGLWLWWPYRKGPAPKPAAPIAQQPPGYTTNEPTTTSPLVNTPIPAPRYNPDKTNIDEKRLQEQLRHQATEFVARAGTYASSDEFAGIKQVYVSATPELRTYLETQRQQLLKDHPLRAKAWGQTVYALSSRFLTSLPLGKAQTVEILVQAQVQAGADGEMEKSYKQATVTYSLVNGTWMASRIVWSDLQI